MKVIIEIKKSEKNDKYYGILTNGFVNRFIDIELCMIILGGSYSNIRVGKYEVVMKGVA